MLKSEVARKCAANWWNWKWVRQKLVVMGGERRGRDEQVSSHGGPLACEEVAKRKGLRKGSTGLEKLV